MLLPFILVYGVIIF